MIYVFSLFPCHASMGAIVAQLGHGDSGLLDLNKSVKLAESLVGDKKPEQQDSPQKMYPQAACSGT